ncbi:MAG: acetoin utilization protein AcuC [Polyangia bacterium]
MGTTRAALADFREHERLVYPPGHPFRPERAGALVELLEREGLLDDSELELVRPEPARREAICRFHRPDYVEALERADAGAMTLTMPRYRLGNSDCPVFPGVWTLARLAAGTTLKLGGMLAEGGAELAFNPLGGFHHAGPATAGGFCYVNDAVLVCRELADRGLRVACLDLDAHHGNGTEEAFAADPRVLTVSLHQDGRTIYPGGGEATSIGSGRGLGFDINLPLPPGAGDRVFWRAVSEVALPALEAFGPGLVVLEIGMDVLAADPLTDLRISDRAVAAAAARVRRLGAPVLALGGGGYAPQEAVRGWARVWRALRSAKADPDGEDRPEDGRDADEQVERAIVFHREQTLPRLEWRSPSPCSNLRS